MLTTLLLLHNKKVDAAVLAQARSYLFEFPSTFHSDAEFDKMNHRWVWVHFRVVVIILWGSEMLLLNIRDESLSTRGNV